jgi:ABC-type Zn uptake system ZnuABC Zn-binding protein ZnuA
MPEETLLKDLKDYEKNAEWFSAKYTEITEKYEGKTVAVKDQRIVTVKATLDETLKEFELKKENINSIYIATIPEKAIAFIL